MKLYIQGDVFLVQIDNLPQAAVKVQKSSKGHVLAEGEHSGHSHIATGEEVFLYEADGTLYLSVNNSAGATITHEEHHAVHVPKGKYKVGIVRQYDHLTEEKYIDALRKASPTIRKVED